MAGRNDHAIADALQALAQAIGNPNKEEDGGAVEYQVSYPNVTTRLVATISPL